MEQVGIQQVQNVQQPTFQGHGQIEQQTVSNPYVQKEDGDKKLMGALIGLGATAAAGIYIAKGKGKLPVAIRNGIGKIFKKGAKEATEQVTEKATKQAPLLLEDIFSKNKREASELLEKLKKEPNNRQIYSNLRKLTVYNADSSAVKSGALSQEQVQTLRAIFDEAKNIFKAS